MKDFNLPKDYTRYIDKYFLRAKKILQEENLNPNVTVQVFLRNANQVFGIEEATAILTKYANINKLYALEEGAKIKPNETVMLIEAPIQEIIDLETIYLGVLSAETTKGIDKGRTDVGLGEIEKNMKIIVDLVKGRPVFYFGARHWRYDDDKAISQACYNAGAIGCSTDIGASNKNEEGIGTIPHSLEAIYHWKYGLKSAVVSSTYAFNRYMNNTIPRIALVDYANREITDSMNIAHIVDAIRIDTCGENFMEGCPDIGKRLNEWYGRGVSVQGVYEVRQKLNDNGFNNVKITLSSGFGNPDKVMKFLKAEQLIGIKLFDSLGVGGVFKSKMATADVIKVEGKEIHKVGRIYKPNSKLKRII